MTTTSIAIDVMGGDFAPRELVQGALQYLTAGGDAHLLLVGKGDAIRDIAGTLPERCEIIDTPEMIEMGEPPAQGLRRKKRASVALAARLVKEGKAQAFLSAGSTGAQLAASLLEIGRIPGIERPGVPVLFPTGSNQGVLAIDVGANVDCRPLHLLHFALMGAAYYERAFGVASPRVGLLNVGAEAGKGNDLTKAVYEQLRGSHLNFVGNVEADHLFEGGTHVVVCDGFVGNVLLKASEGLAGMLLGTVRGALQQSTIDPEAVRTVLSAIRRFQPDLPEYSAAPLLGIAGGSMVLHGKSKAPVVANAINLAARFVKTDVVGLISSHLAQEAPPEAGT